uniref:Glycosyl transferase family 2 n=1 Tax=Cyanothece sp. (strain PCC 7425 / ATCC 29141) TaxID=395961 RepID=B8HPA5_CYAP4
MLLTALQIALLLTSLTALLYYLWCSLCTYRFFARPSLPLPEHPQPVSVLVPVCGLEDNAEANWSALCQQDYGADYEVLFGVRETTDAAVPILKQLVSQFPGRARLMFCEEIRGINYKTSSTSQLLEACRYDWVVFADSDVRVLPHYLATVTAPLADPQVGVVTCAYVSRTPRDLGAAIASLGRCIDFIPSVLVARQLYGGLRFALGATIASRKSLLNSLPEFKTLVNRAGDDYHVGRIVATAGYQVELSQYLVDIDIIHEPLRQTFQRELRWSRVIFRNRGNQYYGLVFTYGTFYSLLLMLVTAAHPWAIALFLLTLTVRLLQVLISLGSLNCWGLLPWLWTLPLREGMSVLIWLLGVSGKQIRWRGRQLEVKPGGFISESAGPEGVIGVN